MQVFIYEFVTGGGMFQLADGAPPSGSLLTEGVAMIAALAEDFTRMADCEVEGLKDSRLSDVSIPGCRLHDVSGRDEEAQLFSRLVVESDCTIVIAPEFDGCLLDRCCRVEAEGGCLLSPGRELVALASDKGRTCSVLAQAGIQVPRGVSVPAGEPLPRDFSYPAVAKPNDGAGSTGVRFVNSPDEVTGEHDGLRLEQYCAGTPASVSVLCGPQARVVLPGCQQILSDDGRFTYLGGRLPLPWPLAQRARALAQQVVDVLPAPIGYLGIDLVLGPDPAGRDDTVIEINPRLTTSYVGLRALAVDNLAAAMVHVARGLEADGGLDLDLRFHDHTIQFRADGVLR